MKALKIVTLAGSLTAIALISGAFTGIPPEPVKGFAVVELFTSEGCSSCPPADQLIAKIQQESKDQPVYILAFHVDYWDRQGWKDAFSDAGYTRRQNEYGAWLKLQSVYTPQVVVNGRQEFVGSQEATLRNAIRSGLQQASTARVELTGVKVDQGQVSWQYHTQGAGRGVSLLLALVERSATTRVRAGENSGRTLSHVQIVRHFETRPLDGKASGAGHLNLPPGVGTQNAEIIAFLQNNDNGEIIAATRSVLP